MKGRYKNKWYEVIQLIGNICVIKINKLAIAVRTDEVYIPAKRKKAVSHGTDGMEK